jgi:hypothetical protein
VLGKNDAGFLRHVFQPDDLGADAEQIFDAPLDAETPDLAGVIAPAAAQ